MRGAELEMTVDKAFKSFALRWSRKMVVRWKGVCVSKEVCSVFRDRECVCVVLGITEQTGKDWCCRRKGGKFLE